MEVEVTQFIAPHGRQREERTTLRDDPALAAAYAKMQANGHRFTAEVLRTGHVSICIESDEDDVVHKLASNGPQVQTAMEQALLEYEARVEGK